MFPQAIPPSQVGLGTPRTRAVHRAIAEARRGVPVVLAARRPLIVAPAETLGAEGLRLIDLLSAIPASLLLAPSRAAAPSRPDALRAAASAAMTIVRNIVPAMSTWPRRFNHVRYQ